MIERKLEKSFKKQKKKENLSDEEKNNNYDDLVELVKTLDKKE